MNLMSPSRLLASVATLTLVAALAACSSSQLARGVPQSIDGGTQLVVPALWASDSSGASGVEPATVWVDSSRTSDQLAYEVNLSDVEAKGGGPMWQAATSSAAAIGSLFSGFDPDDIAYRFDITGPIDGPSAGAILTVGVLAALNNHALDDKTTMTGTISPDGSIGAVGLIPLKIRAAAAEGYSRVLLPAMLTKVNDPDTGKRIDTEVYAKELGVEVVFVRTLPEAYELFTGHSLFPVGAGEPYSFAEFPKLDKARTAATTGLQAVVQARLDAHSDAPTAAVTQLEESRRATSNADPTTAFALAVDALNLFSDWQGETNFRQGVAEVGAEEARSEFAETLDGQLNVIEAQLDEVANTAAAMHVAEALALPGALGWLTYGKAVLSSMKTELSALSEPVDVEKLTDYAGLAAQIVAQCESLFPLMISVLEATPASKSNQDKAVNQFLSGYTNFLVSAGDANLGYLEATVGLSESAESRFTVLELVPVVVELGRNAEAVQPGVESLTIEVEELSTAMTYFVASTSLVTSFSAYGAPEMWLSESEAVAAGDAYLEDAIQQSDQLVSSLSAHLLTKDLNAGFAVWSADWGTAAYEALAEQGSASRGASLALNELWYDVITALSMNAYIDSN